MRVLAGLAWFLAVGCTAAAPDTPPPERSAAVKTRPQVVATSRAAPAPEAPARGWQIVDAEGCSDAIRMQNERLRVLLDGRELPAAVRRFRRGEHEYVRAGECWYRWPLRQSGMALGGEVVSAVGEQALAGGFVRGPWHTRPLDLPVGWIHVSLRRAKGWVDPVRLHGEPAPWPRSATRTESAPPAPARPFD